MGNGWMDASPLPRMMGAAHLGGGVSQPLKEEEDNNNNMGGRWMMVMTIMMGAAHLGGGVSQPLKAVARKGEELSPAAKGNEWKGGGGGEGLSPAPRMEMRCCSPGWRSLSGPQGLVG